MDFPHHEWLGVGYCSSTEGDGDAHPHITVSRCLQSNIAWTFCTSIGFIAKTHFISTQLVFRARLQKQESEFLWGGMIHSFQSSGFPPHPTNNISAALAGTHHRCSQNGGDGSTDTHLQPEQQRGARAAQILQGSSSTRSLPRKSVLQRAKYICNNPYIHPMSIQGVLWWWVVFFVLVCLGFGGVFLVVIFFLHNPVKAK